MFLKIVRSYKKFALLTMLAVIIILFVGSSTANAAPVSSKDFSPEQEAKSWLYYGAVGKCTRDATIVNDYWAALALPAGWIPNSKITVDNVNDGKWFGILGSGTDPSIAYFLYGSPDTSEATKKIMDKENMDCAGDNSVWILDALKFWGFPYDGRVSAGLDAICSFGGKRIDGSNCREGGGDFTGSNQFASQVKIGSLLSWEWSTLNRKLDSDKFKETIDEKVYNNNRPSSLSDAALYVLNKNVFFGGCLDNANPSASSITYDPADKRMYKVSIVNSDYSIGERIYYTSKSDGVHDSNIEYMASTSGAFNNVSTKCITLAENMNKYVQGYADWYSNNGGTVTMPSPATPPGSSVGATGTTCVIDGVGWIVCTATKFMADAADGIGKLVEMMLDVPPINTDTTAGDNGVYNAWVIMRNLANICFVIGFLVIIFSQLTSLGVSNYGIKKALPRLIIAVILVNISYWIAAIAVDISNISGKGIHDLIKGAQSGLNIGISSNWGAITGAFLAGSTITLTGGAIVVGGAIAALTVPALGSALMYLLIPLVLSAVLALFVAIFVLIARQALIIILIVVSPLAFVALLLPNTEKLFTKWRQLLTSLLLAYPLVALIITGSQLAGLVIMSTAGTNPDPIAGMVAIMSGQFVTVAPLFFIPALITKFSGGNLDAIASNITNKGKNMLSGVNKLSRQQGIGKLGLGVDDIRANGLNSRSKTLNRFAGKAAGFANRFGQDAAADKAARGYFGDERQKSYLERLGTDEAFATRAAGGDVVAGTRLASQARAAAKAESLKAAQAPLQEEVAQWRMQGKNVNDELFSRANDGSKTESERSAAMHSLGALGADQHLRSMVGNNSFDQKAVQEAISANAGSLKDKAPDLVKTAGGAFESISKASDVASWSKGTAAAYGEWIKKQNQETAKVSLDSMRTALQDLSKDSGLQASFDQDAKHIIEELATRPSDQ